MKVDIIIVTYNAKENLKRCVKSICRYTRAIPYRLTIVDNNSTDGTSGYFRTLSNDINIIVNGKNIGFPGGANIAIQSTFGRYIALVDDDAEVTKDWLRILRKKIDESPDIGLVGCKIVFPTNMIFCAEIDVGAGCCQNIGYGELDNGQRDYIAEVNSVNGACWLMKREVVNAIGLYDERFFPCQYEDTDYCLRARRAGFRVIYDGKVSIIHHHLYRAGGIKINISNRRKFMRKWKGLKDFTDQKGYKRNKTINFRSKIKGLLSVALRSAQKGDHMTAIRHLRDIVYLNPYDYVAHYHLAMIYKKIGQLDDAKLEASRSIEIFNSIDRKKV